MTIRELLNKKWVVWEDAILRPGRKGEWDDLAVMTPTVFKDDSQRKFCMFYVGVSHRNGNWGIGYAESENVKNWIKHPKNPLLIYNEKDFFYQLDGPFLIRKDNKYYLFCEEKKIRKDFENKIRSLLPFYLKTILKRIIKFTSKTPQAVMHAQDRYFVQFSSTDILDWNLYSKRAIFRKNDNLNSFDSCGVFSPQVYYTDNMYYLFYGGSDGRKTRSGLATSYDFINWKRVEFNPILDTGGMGEWDENNALIVSVLKLEDGYCGFYEGEDRFNRYGVGICFSTDLKTWNKYEKNPIVTYGSVLGYRCKQGVCSPHVIKDEDKILLFFSVQQIPEGSF